MQPVWRYVTAGFILALGALLDFRSQRLPVWYFVVSALAGLLSFALTGLSWRVCVPGLFLSALVLFYGVVSGEQIGYGDGLLLVVSSFLLEAGELFFLFGMALFGAACFSMVLFVGKRAGRKTRIPFVPFLLLSYGVELCLLLGK